MANDTNRINAIAELEKARDSAYKTLQEADTIVSMDIDEYFFFVLKAAKDSDNPTNEEKFKALSDYQNFKNDPTPEIKSELEQFKKDRMKNSPKDNKDTTS